MPKMREGKKPNSSEGCLKFEWEKKIKDLSKWYFPKFRLFKHPVIEDNGGDVHL